MKTSCKLVDPLFPCNCVNMEHGGSDLTS